MLHHYEWAKQLARDQHILDEGHRGTVWRPKTGRKELVASARSPNQPIQKHSIAWFHQHYLSFGLDRRDPAERRPCYAVRFERSFVAVAPCTRKPPPPPKFLLSSGDPDVFWFLPKNTEDTYIWPEMELVSVAGYTGQLLGLVTGAVLLNKLEQFLGGRP